VRKRVVSMEFKEFENDYEEYGFKEVDITGHEQDKIAVERLLRHEHIIEHSVVEDLEERLGGSKWDILLVGYVIAKRPDLITRILEIVNKHKFRKHIDLDDICRLFDDCSGVDAHKEFLVHYAEFANLTPVIRGHINKHLINISIGYGEEANV
jgi:hypothetical protein